MNATKLLVVLFARALQDSNSVEQLVLVSACIITQHAQFIDYLEFTFQISTNVPLSHRCAVKSAQITKEDLNVRVYQATLSAPVIREFVLLTVSVKF